MCGFGQLKPPNFREFVGVLDLARGAIPQLDRRMLTDLEIKRAKPRDAQ
jgi:hypothetical protein